MSKYINNPNLFYSDLTDAAEYLRNVTVPEPVERLPELLYAIACKYSEEGSTTEQDLLLDDAKSI